MIALRGLFQRYEKQRKAAAFDVLNAMETELIALQDITDIMQNLPIEEPPPIYLYCRIEAHVKNLRSRFNTAWDVIIKGQGGE